MIVSAWDEYRSWAKQARALQRSSELWNTGALLAAGAAAAFAAAATQFGAGAQPGTLSELGKWLQGASGASATLVPLLGKEILSTSAESKYIRARAIAEALKSECFRYAARAGDYAGADADDVFVKRLDGFTAAVKELQLSPDRDAVGDGIDKRRPLMDMAADPRVAEKENENPPKTGKAWYLKYRIDDQIKYYDDARRRHARVATWLRVLALVSAAAAALLGYFGAFGQAVLAPWIGVLTTVATALAAQGLMARRQQLAASYGAMATSLGRIKALEPKLDLAALVARTEDLLESEHAAWVEHMTRTIPTPPPQPAAPVKPKSPGNP